MRLQKYLAECGVASRRGAEGAHRAGPCVHRRRGRHPDGVQVEPGDLVEVDGKPSPGWKKSNTYSCISPRALSAPFPIQKGAKPYVTCCPRSRSASIPWAAGLRHRRTAFAHQRRRAQQRPDTPLPRGGQDLLPACARRSFAAIPRQAGERRHLDDGHRTARARVELLEADAGFQGQTILRLHVHEGITAWCAAWCRQWAARSCFCAAKGSVCWVWAGFVPDSGGI